jgi:hypothetical protein
MTTTKNDYDKRDIIRRESVLIADGSGEIKIAAYRVRDPGTDEFSKLQFHFTHNNTVLAVMGEEAAKLFMRFVTDTLAAQPQPGNEVASFGAVSHTADGNQA